MSAFDRMALAEHEALQRMGAEPRPKPYPETGVIVAPGMIPSFNLQITDMIPPAAARLDPCMDPCEAEKYGTELQKQVRAVAKHKKALKPHCFEDDGVFLSPRTDLWKCVNTNTGINCSIDPFTKSGNPKRQPAPPDMMFGSISKDGCKLFSSTAQAQARAADGNQADPCAVPGLRQVSRKMKDKPDCSKQQADCSSRRNPPYQNSRQADSSNNNTTAYFSDQMISSDGMSLATTDTQKLLAMLKESEGEGPEGLSFNSSLRGSNQSSTCESVFEGPATTKLGRKGVKIKVVKKKPSPEHLSRMERKWSAPCGELYEKPPCGGIEYKDKDYDMSRIAPSKNICKKNDDPIVGPLKRGCKQSGYLETHNADFLPPVAHLGQLGPPDRTCCLPTWDPCAPHPRQPQDAGEVVSSKPWRSQTARENSCGQASSGQNNLNMPASSYSQPRSASAGRGCGAPAEPCDLLTWTGHRDHGNEHPLTLGPSVFIPDMNKPQNSQCRGPKTTTITKVAGDPSLIKKAPGSSSKKTSCGPSNMDADELMSLEEDLNDEEQLEDSKRLAIYLSEDLKDQFFTDVTVTAKDHSYKIHKEYLLAFTNYDIPVIEGQPMREMPALSLTELDGADVAAVLHFLYYGKLKATIYNILGVMAAANALGLVDIPSVLQDYHDKLFAAPNQTNIVDFAVCKQMTTLSEYTWRLFVQSFYDHVNGAHFLNWDVRWVNNLLSHEDIPIKTELEVFEAARLWLNNRPEERTDHVRTVLNCVRWTYMTAEEMVCCEREDPCLMNRPEAHELIADANWYKIMIQKGKSWSEFNIKPPRGAYSTKSGVVVPPRPVGCRPTTPCGEKSNKLSCPSAGLARQGESRKSRGPQNPEKENYGKSSNRKKQSEKDERSGDVGGSKANLRSQLARLPPPPESDLFSTISFGSLEVDLSAGSCGDDDLLYCTDGITKF